MYSGSKSKKALLNIYDLDDSVQWAKTYGIFGRQFYIKHMELYSQEIRELMGAVIG